jgi:hypothetical protein
VHPLAVLVLFNTQLLLSALVFTWVGGWLLAPLALVVLGALCWCGFFLLESLRPVRVLGSAVSLSEPATVLVIFGWIVGGWGGALMDEQVGYWVRGVRPEASATRMEEAGRAGLVQLASAELRTELSGRLTHTSTDSKTRGRFTRSWYATPLVAAGWTPGQPVPAWVVSEGAPPARGTELAAVPLHVGNYGTSGWRSRGHYLEVVRAAENAHGLSSTPGAPLFVLVASVDGELRREGLWFWATLGGFNVLAVALLALLGSGPFFSPRSGGAASAAR